jgi:dephospho-CoA kinase
MTREKFAHILRRQLPDEQKRALADFIVDTSGTMEETRAQVRNILTCLGLPTGV